MPALFTKTSSRPSAAPIVASALFTDASSVTSSRRLDHPQVGELTLNRERLSVGGAESLKLVIYHPDPESDDADKLALLASADLPTRTRDGKGSAAPIREARGAAFG
ncbi:MmyB family transcriptional regulator [Sphaerimonospora thailandensis]|uniref:MmyB family transcriptional regulator n=1 Tax=Sphaerimonospora thailandensis TaxID=795644 RepID=UPI001952273A|nr:hypothetical protein [Sphaerimonospora thailandensis]